MKPAKVLLMKSGMTDDVHWVLFTPLGLMACSFSDFVS